MQPYHLNTRQKRIHIRNMICQSCCKVVKWELEKSGFVLVHKVDIGWADISYNEGVFDQNLINEILKFNGFELIEGKDDILVEKIKSAIIRLIFFGNNTNSLIRNSDYLSQALDEPYLHLSKVFSKVTGQTLEKYIIIIKIEKVKELISYDEMSLSEISYQLGYSSVAHLSSQFKQITGFTVQEYKKSYHPRTTL